MKKQKKLDLNELKVESFVTILDEDEKSRLKGGLVDPSDCMPCPTHMSCM